MTREQWTLIHDAAQQRSTSVVDVMCNTLTPNVVLEYYARLVNRVCDHELRASTSLLRDKRTPLALPHAGDSAIPLGLGKFLAERRLDTLNTLSQLSDEASRFGDESLSDEQRKTIDVVTKAIEVIDRYDRVANMVHHSFGDADESAGALLRAIFFVALTHSHALREVVCCQSNAERMRSHGAFGPASAIRVFFGKLPVITERYTRFELTECEYVSEIRTLARTGFTLSELGRMR